MKIKSKYMKIVDTLSFGFDKSIYLMKNSQKYQRNHNIFESQEIRKNEKVCSGFS